MKRVLSLNINRKRDHFMPLVPSGLKLSSLKVREMKLIVKDSHNHIYWFRILLWFDGQR